MSKIFELKEWVTIDEAATYLTNEIGENISEADIYKLAHENKIVLSVWFVYSQYFQYGHLEKLDNTKHFKLVAALDDKNKKILIPIDNILITPDKESVIVFENSINNPIRGEGCYDIVNEWCGFLEIEHIYHNLTTNIDVQSTNIEGVILKHPQKDSLYFRLLDKLYDNLDCKDFYPIGGFPKDSLIVARTEILKEFVSRVNAREETPLMTRERNTLYRIIGSLLIDNKMINRTPNAIGDILEATGKNNGVDNFPNKETIGKVVVKVKELMPDKILKETD